MSAASTLRVAAAQYPLDEVADMAAWCAKTKRWVEEGAASGAKLLVFPEYGAIETAAAHGPAVTGDLARTLAAVAGSLGERNALWATLARAHDVHILAPSGPEQRERGYVNASRLFTPGGTCGVQDKMILTPFERTWGLVAGDQLRVFDTMVGTIGIAICYDSEFPLLVRAQAEAGAQMILVPACTEFASGFYRVRAAAAARALENQIATVLSPVIGLAAWSQAVDRNTGAAGIFVPPDAGLSATGVLAEGQIDATGWITADIDFAALEGLEQGGEMRNRADWALQPGALPQVRHAEVVALR